MEVLCCMCSSQPGSSNLTAQQRCQLAQHLHTRLHSTNMHSQSPPQARSQQHACPQGHVMCFRSVLTWRSGHGVRFSTVHILTAPTHQPSAGVAPRCDPSGDTVMGMMHDLCGPPTCGDVLSTASRRSVACLAGRQAMPLMMRPAPGQAGNRAALGAAADGA